MKKIGLFLLCLLELSCSGQIKKKINGVSFVASREKLVQQHVGDIMKIYANYAAIMPFGFIRDIASPEIIFNTDRQWFGETKIGAEQYIKMLHGNGVKVMVKPQIWIWKGEFTGSLKMKSEEDWKVLENSYHDFLLTYAEMTEDCNADILCIGTELEQFVMHRPKFWEKLISDIRKVYKGQLTYAANWDEYSRIPFWKELDYIGIDAYFPLCEDKTPTVAQCRSGWQPYKSKMEEVSKAIGKPVLFTEFGYRSSDQTAWKPWLVDRHNNNANLVGQSNAMEAIFEEFWKEGWFAGGFVWKWFIDHKRSGGRDDNRFTPQNKPAEKIIAKYFEKY